MPDIYVYDKNESNTDTTGLVGALVPISCEHEEIGNGMSSVTMVHPYDEWGKWQALQYGNILSVPVRVRTTPVIDENNMYVTSVEKWKVKDGVTKTEARVYRKEKNNKRCGKLIAGSDIIVLEKGEDKDHNERFKVKYVKFGRRRKDFVELIWKTGWVSSAALELEEEDVEIPPGTGIEQLCPSGESSDQLFRIQSVERNIESQQITVYAVHISYDLSKMVTYFKDDEVISAKEALTGIMDGFEPVVINDIEQENDFTAYTDSGNERTSCDWRDSSIMSAMLDPETGFAPNWHTELVRDDYDLYFLANGGANRGIRIEHGKNLLGAQMEINMEDLVTAIKPRGVTEKGNALYLKNNDDPPEKKNKQKDYAYDAENFIVSPKAALYGVHAKSIDCEDCTVEKGKKDITKEVARARMRSQVEKMLSMNDAEDNSNKIDQPKITLKVNFVELGQTVEYERYKPLENVYLWDDVVVAAKDFGIEAAARVTRLRLDVMTNRVIEVELGEIDRTGKIYSWQVPKIDGSMLSEKMLNTETPVISLSGGLFTITADQNGICPATSADFSISAMRGYTPIDPVVESVTGLPTGMTISYTPTDVIGLVLFTLSVSEGSTLGNVEQCSGQIVITTSKPTVKELNINWAKVCGGADGEDGSIRQYVYKRLSQDDNDALGGYVPSIDQTANALDEYVPTGWTDNPSGVSEEYPFEWMSYRDRVDGEWTGFITPVIWSHWGKTGRDGDGVEYIYKATVESTAPTIPAYDETSSEYQSNSEFVPDGWNDNPTGVTQYAKYEWVSVRKKTNGVWGGFSNVALWAKYGEQGPQGPQGPSGQNGVSGADGSTVYYESYAPSGYGYTNGDIWYVTSGDGVGNIYRYNNGWSLVNYNYDDLAIKRLVTQSIVSRVISAQMINTLGITSKYIKSNNTPTVRIGIGGYSTFQAKDVGLSSASGLVFEYSNDYENGIVVQKGWIGYDSDGIIIMSNTPYLKFGSSTGYMEFGTHPQSDEYGLVVGGDVLPRTGNTYRLGGNGSGRRWKRLFTNNSVDVSSDKRLKKDIRPLDAHWILKELRARRFRFKDDDRKLHFGFIAQEVNDIIKGTDLYDADLFSDDNPDSLGLVYDELIAVLVEGWQEHEYRINDLEERLSRLEGMLNASN